MTTYNESALARLLEAADENEVMREQLEYLIDHTEGHLECACSECQRYLRARSVLLEIFGEPRTAGVLEMPKAKAA